MATPHIAAEPGQIAPLVLMPGDPKRAARIAAEHLDNAVLVSDVRGIGAWTGTWDGVPVTAMASGMGIPSLSIYATELFRFYGVKRICRVGTCGGIASNVKVKDVAIGASAHTNSGVATLLVPGVSLSLAASPAMLVGAITKATMLTSQPGSHNTANQLGPVVHTGALYSSDFFYLDRPDITAGLAKLGCLGVEMEAAGLYACAAAEGCEALSVCTVSDHLFNHGDDMTAEERETSFELALQIGLAALLA